MRARWQFEQLQTDGKMNSNKTPQHYKIGQYRLTASDLLPLRSYKIMCAHQFGNDNGGAFIISSPASKTVLHEIWIKAYLSCLLLQILRMSTNTPIPQSTLHQTLYQSTIFHPCTQWNLAGSQYIVWTHSVKVAARRPITLLCHTITVYVAVMNEVKYFYGISLSHQKSLRHRRVLKDMTYFNISDKYFSQAHLCV